MRTVAILAASACLFACGDRATDRLRSTTRPTYDKSTGKLKDLTFDSNKNGTIDTWTEMDGARPILARMDTNEDGTIDRWEYYREDGTLLKVGISRKGDGNPDAWVFSGDGGRIERVEVSSIGDHTKIDRREYYDADGRMVRAEEDAGMDGTVDKWETYENGIVATAAFDENADGRPDRRLTYSGGALVLIETEPRGDGGFAKRVDIR
jgi:hypothetical protein